MSHPDTQTKEMHLMDTKGGVREVRGRAGRRWCRIQYNNYSASTHNLAKTCIFNVVILI